MNVLPSGIYGFEKGDGGGRLFAKTYRGAYRTDTGGFYWEKHASFDQWISSVSLGLRPQDTVQYLGISVAPAAGGGGSLWKSPDAGTTWTRIEDGTVSTSIEMILRHPTESDTVYVIAGRKLLKTLNGGRTWRDITPERGRVQFVSQNPTDPNLLLATLGDGYRGVLRLSSDGGLTWTVPSFRIQVQPYGAERYQANSFASAFYHPADGKTIFCLASYESVGYGPSLTVSEDSGMTWREITVREANKGTVFTSYDFTPKALFVGTREGLFKTEDSGRSWTKLLGVPISDVATMKDGAIFVATETGVLKSMSGGRAWRPAGLGLPSRVGFEEKQTDPFTEFDMGKQWDVRSLQLVDDSSGELLVGTGGGILRSNDAFQWTFQPVPGERRSVRQIQPSPDGFYAVLVEQVRMGAGYGFATDFLKISRDGKVASISVGKPVRQILSFSTDPKIVYATVAESYLAGMRSADGDALYISDDGTFSWRSAKIAGAFQSRLPGHGVGDIMKLAASPSAPQRLFVLLETTIPMPKPNGFALLATRDTGENWVDLTGGLDSAAPGLSGEVSTIAVSPLDAQAVLVAGGSRIVRSADGGTTWVSMSMPSGFPKVRHIAFDIEQKTTIWASAGNAVWVSRNSGQTWEALKKGLVGLDGGDEMYQIIPSKFGVFAQGRNGVYRLSDLSRAWAKKAWDATVER